MISEIKGKSFCQKERVQQVGRALFVGGLVTVLVTGVLGSLSLGLGKRFPLSSLAVRVISGSIFVVSSAAFYLILRRRGAVNDSTMKIEDILAELRLMPNMMQMKMKAEKLGGELLGEGKYGAVFGFGEDAIKIKRDPKANPQLVSEAIGDHPAFVKVFHCEKVHKDVFIDWMQRVKGVALENYGTTQFWPGLGNPTFLERLRAGQGLCEGVLALLEKRIVPCDLHRGNIIVGRDGHGAFKCWIVDYDGYMSDKVQLIERGKPLSSERWVKHEDINHLQGVFSRDFEALFRTSYSGEWVARHLVSEPFSSSTIAPGTYPLSEVIDHFKGIFEKVQEELGRLVEGEEKKQQIQRKRSFSFR